MSEIITSLQNPLVKAWRGLNKSRSARVEAGLFLAEGEHMAGEAIKEKKALSLLISDRAKDRYSALAALASAQGLLRYYVSDHVMLSLCDAKTPQGVIAVCAYPKDHEVPASSEFLVALDGVQDPGNVGTIIRTMDAAGYTCLITDEKTADPYSPKALRATMGGAFRIPCVRRDLPQALRALKNQGFEIIAGDLHGEDFFHRPRVKSKVCVVIGNEGQGISPEVFKETTLRLKIPILGGAESLNAAVAGAIMMYDLIRDRID